MQTDFLSPGLRPLWTVDRRSNPSWRKRTVFSYGLILLSSVLMILSFPKISWSFLAWVAFLPFFKSLEDKGAGKRFWLGYGCGFVSSLGIFYWVTHSMRYYGGLDTITSFSILLLMVLYLALYMAVFAWLWGYFPHNGFFSFIWAPSVWVVLEFLRSHLLTGFPWELLGYSQYNYLPVIQIAQITGVLGVSFLIVLGNQALYQLFLTQPLFRNWSSKWIGTLLTLLLIITTLLFGFHSISLQKEKDRGARSLKVAIIQGSIDQSLKWNKAFQEQTINIYSEGTLKYLDKKPDLVIWPETAVPFSFFNENHLTPQLFQLAQETNAFLLFGSPAFASQGGEMKFYNRAYLLGPKGRLEFYDKVHLVPFGEYVPLKKFLPFVGKMVQAIGDFSPGPGSTGLPFSKGKIGVLICFESIFPELSRAYARDGCRLLVNITNDAWFGKTSAPYQHLSMLTFRAIENRVWVARAANTGFSAVIDSTGRIKEKLPLFQTGGIYAMLPMRGEKTFYTIHGDWLVVFCGLIFFIGILVAGKFKKNSG
jgi:apolipoprotein N-acyltransferase